MMEKFRRQGVLRLAAAAIATLWFASAGCEPALQDGPIPPLEPARGKADISEAIAALEAHRARIGPLRAGGNARVEFYEPDGQKRPPENPNIQVRLVPPDLLFFRGEILGNELVRFGTNSTQFWFRIKPKEVSSYWWGLRETARKCRGGGVLNPESVLEALGIVEVDPSWTFQGVRGYDVLTLFDEAGVPVKRVYIDWRDYLVKRIEYYDVYGELAVVAAMSGYGENTDGIPVPTQIDIVYMRGIEGSLSISMKLRDVRRFQPTEAQLRGELFALPPKDGSENVYVLADSCEFVRTD